MVRGLSGSGVEGLGIGLVRAKSGRLDAIRIG